MGIIEGKILFFKGDTRSLDGSSCGTYCMRAQQYLKKLPDSLPQKVCTHHGGFSKGPSKEGTIGNTFLEKGILTKQGTYTMAVLGTGILNNYQVVIYC